MKPISKMLLQKAVNYLPKAVIFHALFRAAALYMREHNILLSEMKLISVMQYLDPYQKYEKPGNIRIAVSNDYGGFHFSYKMMMRYAELKGITIYAYEESFSDNPDDDVKLILINSGEEEDHYFIFYTTFPLEKLIACEENYQYQIDDYDFVRTDPVVIQVVEEFKDETQIRIVEVPDDVDWCIREDIGVEWVAEKHRTWFAKHVYDQDNT